MTKNPKKNSSSEKSGYLTLADMKRIMEIAGDAKYVEAVDRVFLCSEAQLEALRKAENVPNGVLVLHAA